MKSIKNIAIDPGAWAGKLYPGGDPNSVTVVRNVFGEVTEQLYGETLPGLRFEQPWSFSSDEYALRFGGEPITPQDPAWLESKEFAQIMFSLFAKAGIKNGETLESIIAIPINEYSVKDKSGNRIYVDALKKRWTGPQTFQCVGKAPVSFTMAEPKITMQGLAAAIHFAYGPKGQDIHVDALKHGRVFVCDCGGRDMNTALFDHFGTVDGWTRTFREVGFWKIVEEVQTHLQHSYGVVVNKPKLSEALTQEQTVKGKKGYFIFRNNRWIDLTTVTNDLIAYYGRQQCQKLASLPGDIPVMLLCGGTGEKFLPYYQEFRSQFQLIPFPRYATVLGAYRMRFTE